MSANSTNCGSCSTVGHIVLWYISFEKKIRVKVDLWISNLCCSRVNCIHMPSNTYLQINNSLAWQPTPVLLPGKSHGWRSLVGCSPWGHEESDTTKRLHFHFSLSCIGEGNGNPLQCSCLENPRDGEASWAAVSGVAQSRTQLRRLSSSSSSSSSSSILSQGIK